MKSNYDQVGDLNNAKDVFSNIDYHFISKNQFELDENAEIIIDFIVEYSKNFCCDIAKRLKYNGYISEKQRWCLAYEFLKLKEEFYSSFLRNQKIKQNEISRC